MLRPLRGVVFAFVLLTIPQSVLAAINCSFRGGKFEEGFMLCECPVRIIQGSAGRAHLLVSEQQSKSHLLP